MRFLLTLPISVPVAGFALSCLVDYLLCGLCALLCLVLIHLLTANRLPFYLPKAKLLVNGICAIIVLNLCFLLIGNMQIACVLGSLLLLLLATANNYVFRFKGTELLASDFLAIRTAAAVAGGYRYTPPRNVVIAWAAWLSWCILNLLIRFPHSYAFFPIRIVSLLIELALIVLYLRTTKQVKGTRWSNDGSTQYGYLLSFFLSLRDLKGVKPKDYRPEKVDKLAEGFLSASSAEMKPSRRHPDLIVIMNESFADLGILGKRPNTNIPITPVLDSIHENAVRGLALSSVYGGVTANSEYEFLTGNSMAFFPPGTLPYQQYIHGKTYSLVTDLKQQGYQCIATHPYLEKCFARSTVYPALGFDKCFFRDDYPKKDLIRWYISDSEMYDHVIAQYENYSKNGSVFLFGVSVQNHGGYINRGGIMENTVDLTDCPGKYPDAEQYLSLLRLSDQAIDKLLQYFKTVDRDVVVCFFGDHQPGLNERFLEELHGGKFRTLDEKQQLKKVPFFIWANYPIREERLECVSLNYLAGHLLKNAGLPLSPYRQFLDRMEQQIPAVNMDGYWSKASAFFRPVQEAEGLDKQLLSDYRTLVYNNTLDRKHRNHRLFPDWT